MLLVVATSRSWRLHVSLSRVATGLASRRGGSQDSMSHCRPPSARQSDFSALYISLGIKKVSSFECAEGPSRSVAST